MLKKIVLVCATCVIVLASVTVAYAGYGPAITVGNGQYVLTQLRDHTGNIVADVSPSAANYTYKVVVSYDSLSDICVTANGYGLTCSLYYNSSQGVYVIRVHDGLTVEQIFNFTSTYGVIANSDGFVYTATKDSSSDDSVITRNYLDGIWFNTSRSFIAAEAIRDYLYRMLNSMYVALYDLQGTVHTISTNILNVGSFIETIQHDVNESAVSLGTIQNKVLSMNGALFSDDGNSVAYLLEHIKIWTVYINTSVNAINKNLSSVVSDGKLIVDNSSIVDKIDEYFGGSEKRKGIYYWASINYANLSLATSHLFEAKSALAHIRDSLDSVISDGTLKVDNTSVVTAIQSLESALSNLNVTATFDDTNVIDAIQQTSRTLSNYGANIYQSVERLRTTVSEGNTIQRGILNVVSTSDTTLSDISGKLDMQNDYYTALGDYWGDLTTAVETQQMYLAEFDSEIVTIRQLLEKPLTVKTDLTSVTTRLDTLTETASDTIVALSAISDKLDAQNEYYASLADFYGNFDDYFDAQSGLINDIDAEIYFIRQLLQKPLTVTTDFTPVIASVDAVGLNIEDLNANFNTNIGSLLDKLDIVIEGSSESLENRINVTIDASNDAHNVFYVTGEDGEEQSVTEFTGDLTKASGRLLSLLYRLVFADALSTVDGDLDGFEDFFTSQGDDTSTQSMESPYEESENVWLVS